MFVKKIIPTLFAYNDSEFLDKLHTLSFSKEIHIDFMDGVFTKSKSFETTALNHLKNYPGISYEMHLMAYNPLQYLSVIRNASIYKVLIHYEVFSSTKELLETKNIFKKEGIKVFLVLKPQTPLTVLKPFLDEFDGIMFMSVEPGAQGQKFIEQTYDKCHELKGKIPLQCDGGINNSNLEYLFIAGCDIASIGSYISSNTNSKENYKILYEIAKKFN